MRGRPRAKERPQEPPPPRVRRTPPAPAGLDAAGKKLWRTWWQRLAVGGLLTVVDEIAFGRSCQTLARWIQLEHLLQTHGLVSLRRETPGAVPVSAPYPQGSLSLRLSEPLLKMEHAFGLTPASRASVFRQPATPPPHGNSADTEKRRFFWPTASAGPN